MRDSAPSPIGSTALSRSDAGPATSMAKKLQAVALSAIYGISLYASVYLWASHSESFEFVDHAIKDSPALQSRIGIVKEVQLALFGNYRDKFGDADHSTTLTVHVVGASKSAELEVNATKRAGVWRIDRVLMGGESLALD
jgi:hypothetical protein